MGVVRAAVLRAHYKPQGEKVFRLYNVIPQKQSVERWQALYSCPLWFFTGNWGTVKAAQKWVCIC